MLGRYVIYNVASLRGDTVLPRVAVINEVHEDGTVGLSVFARSGDSSHPLDYPLKRFPKVKFGDGIGECQFINDEPMTATEVIQRNKDFKIK